MNPILGYLYSKQKVFYLTCEAVQALGHSLKVVFSGMMDRMH